MKLASMHERLERRRRRRRNSERLRQVAGVAVRYGLADLLRKIPGRRIQPWLKACAPEP